MYRIILIDDEPQIRHGLSNLIIWDELGIEPVGEASNGQEALELIEKVSPDIAIVDIQMPVMDGISFLRAAKEKGVSTKFIMLSGFNQFDYVRTSLTLGACNYLLKPVNEDELKNTLQETISLIDDEATKKQQFDESMSSLLNNTLNRLLTNRIDVRELREKCELLNITFRCNNMSVGIIKPVFDNSDNSLRNIMFDSLDLCNDFFHNSIEAYCVADSMDNIAIIFKDSDGNYSNEDIKKMLSDCSIKIEQSIGPKCTYALGCDAASFRELPISYQNALHMVDMILLWGDNEATNNFYIKAQTGVSSTFDFSEMHKQFSSGNLDAFSELVINAYIKILKFNPQSDLLSVKFHMVELVSQVLDVASKAYISEQDLIKLKNEMYVEIKESQNLTQLQNTIESFIISLRNLSNNTISYGYSQNVSMAVSYIIRNYNDSNLSLKTLANQLGINPAYLGRQFNIETGMFFSDYLNNLRIRESRRLLSSTNMKVSDISSAVGFTSVSYFNTIYKKITGERPGQRSR